MFATLERTQYQPQQYNGEYSGLQTRLPGINTLLGYFLYSTLHQKMNQNSHALKIYAKNLDYSHGFELKTQPQTASIQFLFIIKAVKMIMDSSGGNEVERYQRISKIGEGTYGVVYKARDKISNQIVAVKKIRLDHQDQGIPSTAVRQISLLKKLTHPNIVNLKEVVSAQNKLNLIFQYVDCDLKKYLEGIIINEEQVKSIIYQLLLALEYCHSNRIVHRDLKPQNILVQRQTLNIKLADFGLARIYNYPLREYTHQIITLWYRAPEVLLGMEKYYPTVDIWSVGCIFYQIAHKKCLFCGDSEIDQIFRIFRVMGTPNQATWPDVLKLKDFKTTFPKWSQNTLQTLCAKISGQGIDLLKKMLIYDPLQRITPEQALNHPYFNTLIKSKFAERNY